LEKKRPYLSFSGVTGPSLFLLLDINSMQDFGSISGCGYGKAGKTS
jgi:hypothetical protein